MPDHRGKHGLDYSWARPRPTAIKVAGYTFVLRYLCWVDDRTRGKLLTKPEADALLAQGIDIISNWETTAAESKGGYSAGRANAIEAERLHKAAGGPPNAAIYFSIDYDARNELAVNKAYFEGINSVMPVHRIGVYSGTPLIKFIKEAGLAKFTWNTQGWSDGQWFPERDLHQYYPSEVFDGAAVDRNLAYSSNLGSWLNSKGDFLMGLSDVEQRQVYDAVAMGSVTKTGVPVLPRWLQRILFGKDPYNGEAFYGLSQVQADFGRVRAELAALAQVVATLANGQTGEDELPVTKEEVLAVVQGAADRVLREAFGSVDEEPVL